MNPPYPPLPKRTWRKAQPAMPIIYGIDLAQPVFHVGPIPVYARPNGIGVDWLFQINRVWKASDSTQGAVSDIEYLSQFDFSSTFEVLVIDLMIELTVMRLTVARLECEHTTQLINAATLETVGQYFRMGIPYAEEVAADIAQLAVVYNGGVEASRDRPDGLHNPERYIATNWRPTYTYLKALKPRAIFAHQKFLSTIGRRK